MPPSLNAGSREVRKECVPQGVEVAEEGTFRPLDHIGDAGFVEVMLEHVAAHPACRAHALHDTRRKRRGANRSGRPVEHGTVRRRAARKVVALDDALEPLAAAGPDDVNAVS